MNNYNETRRLAIIAARAGSKGLPDKNIRSFCGKPLLVHTIEQAVASEIFDCIAISSDCDTYIDLAMRAGASLAVKRPDSLAGDFVGKPPVLAHALSLAEKEANFKFDIVVDLQPTSPLRHENDILGAVAHLEASGELNCVVSVCDVKASPYYTLVEDKGDGTITLSKPLSKLANRRQDLPICYELNGSIYAWRRSSILAQMPALNDRTGFWLMSRQCNFDIDDETDFAVSEFVATRYFNF